MNFPWKASWISPILRQPEGATSSLVRLQLPLKLHSGLAQTCHADDVNPGLINPKRLFNWEGTIKKYQMKWLLEEYPLINKLW